MKKNDINVCQHDTLRVSLDLYKEDGTTYTMQSGDYLWLTAKKNISSTAVLNLTSTTINFTITHVSLNVDTYLLEIGMHYASGEEETLIQGRLIVEDRLKGVTAS